MSSYLTTVIFGCKGLLEFTQGAFKKAEKDFLKDALNVDLAGKVVVVSGANSGLGYCTAKELAIRNATVYMICRNPQTGEKARLEIVEASKNEKVYLNIADMSIPKSLKAFADKFVASNKTLDVLINNAGTLINERTETSDGVESSFAANTLGTYYLTQQLLPLLEATANSRIITVSSGGMYNCKLSADDLELVNVKTWDGPAAYAQSKRFQVEYMSFLASTHSSIHCYSMHPGWSDTPGVQKSLPSFRKALGSYLRTPEQGADTIIWAAISEQATAEAPSGSFLFDRKVARIHLPFSDTTASSGTLAQVIEKLDRYIGKLAV